MPRCNHRLISLFVILAVSLAVAWGCTQTDDIVAGITTTNIKIGVERLPSTPTGMVYELWVADQNDTVSLGQFGWDNVMKEVLLPSGANRPDSNKFVLSDDLFDFSSIFVSVEIAGSNPTSPGPIMLIDQVSDPNDAQMEMVFPESDSLWLATVRYNMQPTSANSRAGDGTAVWFANYRSTADTTPDTTALAWTFTSEVRALLVLDTQPGGQIDSIFLTPEFDTLTPAEVFVKVPWTISNVTVDSSLKVYSPNTLNLGYNIINGYHTFVTYQEDSIIDSTPPYQRHRYNFTWTINSESMPMDIFTQDDFGLPNLDAYGWKYKGWIISTALDTNVVPTRFTELAWPVEALGTSGIIAASASGMFTTGTFSNIAAADDGNPFVLAGGQVPPYPGEDFLNPTTLMAEYGIGAPINLRSSSVAPVVVSTVFISLEPNNALTDTTNFPLVAFTGLVPFNAGELTGSQVQVNMWNWTQSVNGNIYGFPKIRISIERL